MTIADKQSKCVCTIIPLYNAEFSINTVYTYRHNIFSKTYSIFIYAGFIGKITNEKHYKQFNITEEQFDNSFIDLSVLREQRINKILN